MKEEMKTAAYSDFQHVKPINPTIEAVKKAPVGFFKLNIVIIQRGIISSLAGAFLYYKSRRKEEQHGNKVKEPQS